MKIGLVVTGVAVVAALAVGAFYFFRKGQPAPSARVVRAESEKGPAIPEQKAAGIAPPATQATPESAGVQHGTSAAPKVPEKAVEAPANPANEGSHPPPAPVATSEAQASPTRLELPAGPGSPPATTAPESVDHLAPGTVFAGSATTGSGAPEKLYLEITGLQADDKQIAALLRNSGGWGDARAFQGTFAINPTDQAISVTLATQRGQAVRQGGPFLERNESWQIVFQFSGGRLTGHSGEWDYAFTRLPATEAAALKARLDAQAGALRAATAPGLVYRGSVHGKTTPDSFEYLLRFNRQENDGAVLGLTIEPPGRGSWQRTFSGAIIGSRDRAEGWPLRLKTRAGDAVRAAGTNAVLSAPVDYEVKLKLVDGRLTGESQDFTWDFGLVPAAEVAKFDAAQAERELEFFAVVKTGATFNGQASSADGAQKERVRVRFRRVDERGGTVEAVVESLESTGVYRDFRGAADLDDGRLILTTHGHAHGHPGAAVHFPALVEASTEMTMSFSADGGKLAAELKPSGWNVDF